MTARPDGRMVAGGIHETQVIAGALAGQGGQHGMLLIISEAAFVRVCGFEGDERVERRTRKKKRRRTSEMR